MQYEARLSTTDKTTTFSQHDTADDTVHIDDGFVDGRTHR